MRTWIFQGNPKLFDMTGYFQASAGLVMWSVARYDEEIAPGDTVYIWRSKAADRTPAGVVAEGTIVEVPHVQPEDAEAIRFWHSPDYAREGMKVKIRLNRIAGDKGVLKRDWMKGDSVLRDLLILRQAAGTNFPVADEQARRLGQLWRKTGTDWSRDEVIGALKLYEDLLGRPISKIPGSPVEHLSQQIGRAPTGVYNKLKRRGSMTCSSIKDVPCHSCDYPGS